MLKGCYFRRLSAIACFAFCTLAVILWIHSYYASDHLNICYDAGKSVAFGAQQAPAYRWASANTSLGIVSFNVNPAHAVPIELGGVRTGVHYHSAEVSDEWWWKREAKFGFAYRPSSRGHLLAVPFWFLTLLTAAAGTLFWMQRPYRFTLRGALVATTLIAVVLGIGVASSR
ncbi:MAG: hypothetical protein JNL18_24530 [Planctomycetaceae bacterium]|nr:hypothetical protein [Planctomycetaceae bacterium]